MSVGSCATLKVKKSYAHVCMELNVFQFLLVTPCSVASHY